MSGNFQRLGDLAAMEEHDFGEVWRAFRAGLPVDDFDDATAAEAEDFVRRITSDFLIAYPHRPTKQKLARADSIPPRN
jgi:hypothetical protein